MAGVKKLSLKVKPDDVLMASLVLTAVMACAYAYVARGHRYVHVSISYAGDAAATTDPTNSSTTVPSSEAVRTWRFPPRYELAPAQADGLEPRAAPALALLLAGSHPRSCQALAFVALGAAGGNHLVYIKLLGLAEINAPGDLVITLDAATVYLAALLNLLGFLALLLGAGEPSPGSSAITKLLQHRCWTWSSTSMDWLSILCWYIACLLQLEFEMQYSYSMVSPMSSSYGALRWCHGPVPCVMSFMPYVRRVLFHLISTNTLQEFVEYSM